MNSEPRWQCVLICWGEKYGAGDINHLVDSLTAQTAAPPRFVLLTDRPRQGLDPRVHSRPIPAFWLKPEFLRGGCQAKLGMFEAGALPDDLPAVYIDLDTVILGDMAEAVGFLDDARTICLLQSAILPFGPVGRLVHRLTRGRHYARGNSSIIVFHPREAVDVATRFRQCFERYGPQGIRPMAADERFISWAAQPRMKAVPAWFAVKFPTEFMWPQRWIVDLRNRLPWIVSRRARLRAITLPGLEVKPEALLALPDGAEIVDRKGRRLFWTESALGPVRERLLADARRLIEHRQRAEAGRLPV
jgi:hypothetical protein